MGNKVKFNLKNVHYAPLSFSGIAPAFGPPVPIPGAVSLTLSANSETTEFYAGGIYYKVAVGQGYDGDLGIAVIPDDFRAYALSEEFDADDVLTEKADGRLRPFALLFEFDGDRNHTRHVLYNCTASYPEISSKTNEDRKKIEPESLHVSAEPLPGGAVRAKTGERTSREVYDEWFSQVHFIPENAISDFSSFTIDGIPFMGLCEIGRTTTIAASEISGLMMDKSYFNDVYGSYLSYSISIRLPVYDKGAYDTIYEMLTDPVDAHSFIFDYGQDHITITGRVEDVSDKLVRTRGNAKYWDALAVTVIANHPSKQMSLGEVVTRGRSPLPSEAGAVIGDLYEYTASGWERRYYMDADEIYY